ncbi:zinc finger MYND domain-containing protein 11 [Caerostris darwini]|uniref:Zinc finger MYND domain-containing protein 11 n=1 Tax=Caerostris darwini TaxID=1538125 RepID=A0AAV4TUS7_9ARAC|nr:zinc finger MYND domain-containing protein 11 [Caerostris darwini]
MRPRGKTQQRYNEAIQILSGTQVKNHNCSTKISIPIKMATKRRQACPQTVLHLWDAIAYIRQQKQIPNFERLSAYMKRVYSLNPPDVERQLNFAVSDGLIRIRKSLGCKGARVGIEQDGYRVPEEINERDDHDWYCFVCHRGGEVVLCSTCHRVYHQHCLKVKNLPEKFVCPSCENSKKFHVDLKKFELNKLLSFTCVRLKEKTRELHRIPHPDDEKWRHNFLIYDSSDLIAMEDKVKANEYVRLGDFYSDAQQIVHNVVIYFGRESRIAVMALQMLSDCDYDLQEIVQCWNCYKMSNMKNDSYWFCQPCNPPHALVYAKVKGFPYWPAKVIKKDEGVYDVRFFGAHHQRALVEEDNVKPVTISYQKLGVKKTASFERAYKELAHHQQLVEKASKKLLTDNDKERNDSVNEENNSTENETVMGLNNLSKSKTPVSRKRKSTSTPIAKPPSAKKPASVPVKKNKKFYQESPTSSSPKNIPSENHSLLDDIYGVERIKRKYTRKRTRNSHLSDDIQLLYEVERMKGNHQRRLRNSRISEDIQLIHEVGRIKRKYTRRLRDAVVSEDNNDQNLVSSSSQETAVSYSSVAIQTENETCSKQERKRSIGRPKGSFRRHHRVVEKDESPPSVNMDTSTNDKVEKTHDCVNSSINNVENTPNCVDTSTNNNKAEKTCDCSAKYEKALQDLRNSLEEEHKKDKSKALQELSEKLQKEVQIENEKQKYLASHIEKLQQDHKDALHKLRIECQTNHEEQMRQAEEKYKAIISETKKKQWCYNCETEAIYHCCWNTSYCSVECQQVHWHKEHKRTCRRKR